MDTVGRDEALARVKALAAEVQEKRGRQRRATPKFHVEQKKQRVRAWSTRCCLQT